MPRCFDLLHKKKLKVRPRSTSSDKVKMNSLVLHITTIITPPACLILLADGERERLPSGQEVEEVLQLSSYSALYHHLIMQLTQVFLPKPYRNCTRLGDSYRIMAVASPPLTSSSSSASELMNHFCTLTPAQFCQQVNTGNPLVLGNPKEMKEKSVAFFVLVNKPTCLFLAAFRRGSDERRFEFCCRPQQVISKKCQSKKNLVCFYLLSKRGKDNLVPTLLLSIIISKKNVHYFCCVCVCV